MIRPLLRLPLSCLLLLVLSTACRAAPEVLPPWAREIVARPAPVAPATADTIILFNEALVDFAPDGRRTTRQRMVLRVLRHEGREQAKASASYTRPGDKVRELNAWLQNSDATVRHFGRKEVVDLALQLDALYSESRIALIDASLEADTGSIFAWESVTEEPAYSSQGSWSFQLRWPVAQSRCLLRLPTGWRAEGALVNHPTMTPVPTADGLLWEVRNLPGLAAEPLAPNSERRCAGLRFTIFPLPDAKGRLALRTFTTWSDVTRFELEKFAPAIRANPEIDAKVREFCLGKSTPWEKIRALGSFVQRLRYVGIWANLSKDGGVVPHPAGEVLRCGYGDCKDKTALLCTMLKVAGITAHPVLCFSGDRTAVQADWPAMGQFNHVFVAIPVDSSVVSPFIVDDAQAGRLLLFDPTDVDTPIGDFPAYNQGGLVLVCTPGADRLTPVPHDPAGAYRVVLHTSAVIAPTGSAEVDLSETNQGSAAAAERSRRTERAKKGKSTTAWFKEAIPGAEVRQVEFTDTPEDGAFTLTAKFALPKFGQAVRRDMLAIKPHVAWSMAVPPLNEKTRILPILLSALHNEVVAEFIIPDGFRVSDPGPALTLERSFGRYEAQTVCEGQKAVFRRTVVLQPVELSPDHYDEVRAFFDAIRKRENTPIMIERR